MTSLYIKQHNKTGLTYFGKTDNSDPVAYQGSGSYWKAHLAVHGNDVSTIWHQEFNDREELIRYATEFSISNNIVEAMDINGKKIWANLVNENGTDGFPKGGKMPERTPLHKKNWANSKNGWNPSDTTRQLWSTQRTGTIVSAETKLIHSQQTSGEKNPNALEWEIYYPTGEVIKVKGLRAFCRKNNLPFGKIYRSTGGWKSVKYGHGKGGRQHNVH